MSSVIEMIVPGRRTFIFCRVKVPMAMPHIWYNYCIAPGRICCILLRFSAGPCLADMSSVINDESSSLLGSSELTFDSGSSEKSAKCGSYAVPVHMWATVCRQWAWLHNCTFLCWFYNFAFAFAVAASIQTAEAPTYYTVNSESHFIDEVKCSFRWQSNRHKFISSAVFPYKQIHSTSAVALKASGGGERDRSGMKECVLVLGCARSAMLSMCKSTIPNRRTSSSFIQNIFRKIMRLCGCVCVCVFDCVNAGMIPRWDFGLYPFTHPFSETHFIVPIPGDPERNNAKTPPQTPPPLYRHNSQQFYYAIRNDRFPLPHRNNASQTDDNVRNGVSHNVVIAYARKYKYKLQCHLLRMESLFAHSRYISTTTTTFVTFVHDSYAGEKSPIFSTTHTHTYWM